jgi:EmrB/QacA subfamily drug resistance transporter
MSTTSALTTTAGVAQRDRPAASAWFGFAVVTVAAVMDLLDTTITQTASPYIRRELGGSYSDLQWISAAYTLAMAALMLVGGRLGDIFGRRVVLLSSMGGFMVCSTLCALAPSASTLVAARALQGAVAAMMVPQCFGLIRELFGDEGQQQALSVFGPIMGLAAIVGPLAGGGLIALNLLGLTWRAIFLVNVPVGLVATVIGLRRLPKDRPSKAAARPDAVSALLAAAIGVLLVYPLIEGRAHGWPLWAFAMIAVGVALVGVFASRQSRLVRGGRAPLVEPTILTRRGYSSGLMVVLGFIGAMGGVLLCFNVMFQAGLGFSPLSSAVATVPIPVVAIAGSITSSVLLPQIGRATMQIGTTVMAVGALVVIVVLRADAGGVSAWDLTAPLALLGFGMGMVFVPMFDLILANVEPHELGSASGLLESTQQLAMSLGIAIVGSVLFDQAGSRHGAGVFVHATSDSLFVVVGLLAAAWLATWRVPKHARASHQEALDQKLAAIAPDLAIAPDRSSQTTAEAG